MVRYGSADVHLNLCHRGVLIIWLVNDCNGLNLMDYRWTGQSVRRVRGCCKREKVSEVVFALPGFPSPNLKIS